MKRKTLRRSRVDNVLKISVKITSEKYSNTSKNQALARRIAVNQRRVNHIEVPLATRITLRLRIKIDPIDLQYFEMLFRHSPRTHAEIRDSSENMCSGIKILI